MDSLSLTQGFIIGYFLIIYGIGLFKKSESNLHSFVFAGRKLTLPAFVATLVSTWYGGILEVGRFSYENGIVTWIIFGFFYYIAALFFAFFFAPKISKLNIKSIPSLFLVRYGKAPAVISIIIILLISSPAPYLKIFSTIISQFWNISESSAILIGITISVLYAIRGGFSAVVRTDKFQFLLMFFGFALILGNLINQYGGYSYIQNNTPPHLLEIPGNFDWKSIFVWGFIALITFIDPGFFQRSFSGTDEKTVKNGILISILFWMLFDFMTIVTGIYAASILTEVHSSPYLDLAKLILSPISYSIFIIALLSIVMSTIDSFTFISAYTIGMDLTAILGKNKNIVFNTKVGLIISSLIAFLMAIYFSNAVEIWYIVGSIAVPVLLVPIFFGLYNLNLKYPIVQLLTPLVITLFWMVNGFNNLDDWGYPIYIFGLDPMYPGVFSSIFLAFILKEIDAK